MWILAVDLVHHLQLKIILENVKMDFYVNFGSRDSTSFATKNYSAKRSDRYFEK